MAKSKSSTGTPANTPVKVKETTLKNTKLNLVKLDWKEVYYTNCPLVSASNVDEGLGLTKKEYKKIGVKFAYMRSTPLTDWYPHYIHNQENLIRFGGLFPPIEVHADIRRTCLLGVTQMPAEGGVMMVRAKDDIFRMTELKGKKIGISKSMNKIKNDWWRIQEHQGIELMLRMNGMTMADIQLVEFPYADDWYNLPEMMKATMDLSIDLWLKRDHKRDLAFRPLETALEKGVIDAMYMQTKPLQQVSEATGKFAAIEDLSRYPDWRLQVANIPAAITCTDVMAEEHPELAVTFMKGMIRAGRWANENKRAAAEILDQQTFYRDIEHTYQGIRDVDLVPNLSPLNLAAVEVGKNFMLRHGYIKNDFDVNEWAAPEFLEQAARELLEDQWQKTTKSKLPSAAAALASPGRIG
ncbi:MAG: ABC transporter substrate-binding protein [Comamonadaceae bacterium]|nr:ABC transporter substrate-binding protein [Comamonadaceae bacterium]